MICKQKIAKEGNQYKGVNMNGYLSIQDEVDRKFDEMTRVMTHEQHCLVERLLLKRSRELLPLQELQDLLAEVKNISLMQTEPMSLIGIVTRPATADLLGVIQAYNLPQPILFNYATIVNGDDHPLIEGDRVEFSLRKAIRFPSPEAQMVAKITVSEEDIPPVYSEEQAIKAAGD